MSTKTKPIDPSPTPWDFSTWGFYCDTCEVFFDLVRDGVVTTREEAGIYTCTRFHKACGQEARYIGYVRGTAAHICPKCNGERYVATVSNSFTIAVSQTRICPTCNGAGILWEPTAVSDFVHPSPATSGKALLRRISGGPAGVKF